MNRRTAEQRPASQFSLAVRTGRRHTSIVRALRVLFVLLLVGGTAVWRHNASADEVPAPDTASLQAVRAAGFTQTTTVSPQAVPAGATATITTAVTATRSTLVNGIIDIEVFNSANQRVGQQAFLGQTIGAGQTVTQRFAWPSQAAGAYRVAVGVFGAGWRPVYLWDQSAAAITVTDAAPSSTATTAATATRTNTAVPPTSTSTATVMPPTSTKTATPALPTATGTAVPPSSTRTPVPATGTNTNTPVPPSATGTAVATGPAFTQVTTANPAGGGSSFTISTTVTDMAGSLQNGIIDIEVYNAAYQKVGQQFFSNQNLVKGQSIGHVITWTAPAAGSYFVATGVFGPNWAPNYMWSLPATTFAEGAATATATGTDTAVPPTNTSTHTPVPPSSTRTPIPASATSTNTPVSASATSTKTAVGPTSTFTPVRPTATGTPSGSSGCQFPSALAGTTAAFCDTFDAPAGTGNRSGQLNGTVWGVSRISTGANFGQQQFDQWSNSSAAACNTQPVTSPNDVQDCNGQFVETVNDGGTPSVEGNGGQTVLAAYPKQPFDFAGRTGKVVFDVGDDTHGGHTAWPAFVLTNLPVPAPYQTAPGLTPYAPNSFGFSLALLCASGSPCPNNTPGCPFPAGIGAGVDSAYITTNYVLTQLNIQQEGCVTQPTHFGQLNHFEVDFSLGEVDIYGTDAGATPSTQRLIAKITGFTMPLTRGFIWMEDIHYNACKYNETQCNHSFAWDNVGFDGPVLPRDLSFDVLDSGSSGNLGWLISGSAATLSTVPAVSAANLAAAQGAVVTLSAYPDYNVVPTLHYSLNGGPTHTYSWPSNLAMGAQWPGLALPVPLSEIRTGTNTITISATGGDTQIANVDLKLLGAAGIVPPS